MKLIFPAVKIPALAEKYIKGMNKRDRDLTEQIALIFPEYRKRGYLTKEEFLTVCRWKTPRTQSLCAKNSEISIKSVSSFVFTTPDEWLRINAWMMLSGISWPTASVFLHFSFPKEYPILDYRALESLGYDKMKLPSYTFDFWMQYVTYCQGVAKEERISMRTLDQALWQHSKENDKGNPMVFAPQCRRQLTPSLYVQ